MTIRFLGNNILIRDGNIALHEDCCCTPPCLPCDDICKFCNGGECNDCLEITGYTFTLEDFEAYDPYFPCNCDEVNATYVVSSPVNGVCNWVDNCVLSQLDNACAKACSETDSKARFKSFQIRSYLAFSQSEVTFTSGELMAGKIPGTYFNHKVCNDYTLFKGHYLIVRIFETSYNLRTILSDPTFCYFANRDITFIFSFNNKFDVENCPEDQFQGTCSGLYIDTGFPAPSMTPLAVSGYYTENPPPANQYGPCTYFYFYDCDNYPQLCNLGDVKVNSVAITPLTPPPC